MHRKTPIAAILATTTVVGVLWLGAGPALANGAPTCHAVSDHSPGSGADRLVSFPVDDVDAAVLVGSLGTSNVEAVAFDPVLGVLWAVEDHGSTSQLGVVDTATGVRSPVLPSSNTAVMNATVAGPTDDDVDDVDALAVDPITGLIWAGNRNGGSTPDSIFVLDPITGAVVPDYFGPGVDGVDAWHATNPSWSRDIDDFAIDPVTGVLYAVANASGNDDRLVWLDKLTGEMHEVAYFQQSSNVNDLFQDVEALAFGNDGTFYGQQGAVGGDDFGVIDTSVAPGLQNTTVQGELEVYDGNERLDDFEGLACLTSLPNTIEGTVFHDVDRDGVQDPSETGTADVTVTLWRDVDADGVVSGADYIADTTTTANNGDYSFVFAAAEQWVIEIDTTTLPGNHSLTTDNVETADFGSGQNAQFGLIDGNNDFGYAVNRAVRGLVWQDDDADGVVDSNETVRTQGVTVWLYADYGRPGVLDSADTLLDSTSSLANGRYRLTTSFGGNMIVVADAADLPLNHSFTTPSTYVVQILSHIDGGRPNFGHRGELVYVDGVVWGDDDGDGVLAPSETDRTAGVTVSLYKDESPVGVFDPNDTLLDTDDSAADGSYHVGAASTYGDFIVLVDAADLPAGETLTTPGLYTHYFPYPVYGNAVDNFGHWVTPPATNTVTGVVYADLDSDGVKDPGETAGYENVTVELWHDVNGNGALDGYDVQLATTITTATGSYSMTTALNTNHVIVIDEGSLPPMTLLTSDNIETAVFAEPGGATDPDNDFGVGVHPGPNECEDLIPTPNYSGPAPHAPCRQPTAARCNDEVQRAAGGYFLEDLLEAHTTGDFKRWPRRVVRIVRLGFASRGFGVVFRSV